MFSTSGDVSSGFKARVDSLISLGIGVHVTYGVTPAGLLMASMAAETGTYCALPTALCRLGLGFLYIS